MICRDFPGGPVVKTLRSQCRGHGFDPWSKIKLGTKIPHAVQRGQIKKKKEKKKSSENQL